MKYLIFLLLPLIQFTMFTVPMEVKWTQFDPAFAYDTGSITIIQNVYDNLIQYKGDKFVPVISENVPSQASGTIINGTEYIFHIRKNAYFHNGDLITPYDVKYSIMRNLLIGYNNGPSWILYKAIFNVDNFDALFYKITGLEYKQCIKDNHFMLEYLLSFYKFYNYINSHILVRGNDIIFKLVVSNSSFLNIMASPSTWSAIYDSAVMKRYGWDGTVYTALDLHLLKSGQTYLSNHFQGSGPYKVVYKTHDTIIFKAYKNYYRKRPYIQDAKFVIDTDKDSRFSKTLDGTYSIIYPYNEMMPLYQSHQHCYQIKNLYSISNRGILLQWDVNPNSKIIFSGKWGNGIPYNAFTDIDFRKAFLQQIPFYTVNLMYWHNSVIQTPGAIPDGFPYFSMNIPMWEMNISIAKKYFQKQWNGEVWKKGFKFRVYYFKESKVVELLMQQYANVLKTINPKFILIPTQCEWKEYLPLLESGELPIIQSGWMADYYDAYDFVYTYMGSTGFYGSKLGIDYKKWQNTNVDPILNKILYSTNPQEIQQYYNVLMAYNYYFQLGVYIQSQKYIVINDKYKYNTNPIYSGVYLYYVESR